MPAGFQTFHVEPAERTGWRRVWTIPAGSNQFDALDGKPVRLVMLPDWLEHGYLGTGITALVVDIGHRRWTLVPGNSYAGFEAFVGTWRSHVSPAGHHHRRRWRADHRWLHQPAAPGATSFGPARLSCEVVGAIQNLEKG